MAPILTDKCINCDVCEPECQQVCPVDCIPRDPAFIETEEQLMVKYEKLVAVG
nr:hypothetical protein [Zhongshania sp.]